MLYLDICGEVEAVCGTDETVLIWRTQNWSQIFATATFKRVDGI